MTEPPENDYDNDFLKIFNNSLVGMLLSGEDHLIRMINNHLLELAELDRDDVIGKTGLELGLLNDAFIKCIWQEFTTTEKLLNRELSFKTKSNNTIHCLFSTEKIILNKKVYWLTTIIDIRNRKKTEKELAEVYERVSDGFIAIDNTWHYTYINKKAAAILGKDPAYLLGKHVWTEYPQQADNPFFIAYHQAMEKQEMMIVEAYSPSYECWFQNLIYPSADGLSVIFRDVTERKQAEIMLEESRRQLKELSGYLQQVREEERTNIAHEIHGELGQQLTGLKMDIAWLMKKTGSDNPAIQQKFDDALALVDNTVNSIRRIVTELRPSIIDDLGLNAAMEWQAGEFAKRMFIEVEYNNNFDDSNIKPATSIGLFRILQESLMNVGKHAGAKKIKIRVQKINQSVRLTVEDDGVDFSSTEKQGQLTFGLIGIKERTSMLQGDCAIFYRQGIGTCIQVTVPLNNG
jgi:PAS domain S-box-containing protein